ncbi:hypothetical protein ATO8_19344 [Roseivivax marinus]|uniref:Uncharacterized protein n=1 Tax=Roseivivax marinus TaxID=1379903 RepID=W4HF41_9RHOB|nr:hypothetical protein [Roseivivax marinus]ETW11008.1 hypothetical protein ATO8_19344 [Roseivivax marinus]
MTDEDIMKLEQERETAEMTLTRISTEETQLLKYAMHTQKGADLEAAFAKNDERRAAFNSWKDVMHRLLAAREHAS